MALKTCPDCKKEISSRASACPHCGRTTSHPWVWMVVRLLLFVAFLFVIYHVVLPKLGILTPHGRLRL